MSKTSRERIAVVFLALLVVFLGACLLGYMNLGRNWNIAASYVDDKVGSMDGYTVVVYKGTVTPEAEDDGIPRSEGGLFGEELDSSDDAADSGLPEESADEASLAEESQVELDEAVEGEDAEATEGTSFADRFLPLIGDSAEESAPLYVSDVRLDYLSKNACVVTLDTSNLHRYAEPSVLLSGSKRIGVVSTESPLTVARLNVFNEFFEQREVDMVICLTPRYDYLPSCDGIDIVLVTTAEEGFTTVGSNRGGAYVLRAPEIDSVGAILITSNGVVSSKVIDVL